MDIEKLIEQLNDWNEKYISNLCGERTIKCEEYCIKDDCLIVKAATALSTLQAENEKLRAELEAYRNGHCAEGGCAAEKDRDAVLAKLERVTAERDAAEKEITRLKAIMREKGIFTIPAKYPWEKPEWNW